MKKYGIVKNGVILERFSDRDEMKREFIKRREEDKELWGRELKFDELLEDEKLEVMEEKLKELRDFLDFARENYDGRTIQTHTRIYADELQWLIEHAKSNLGYTNS
ncbi:MULTISPECIES: hypothetical protein [Bacillus]|uniref:Uncharacterized protein n=1 Tax=Bacillus cereus TaxID=1396 RepID=A0A9X6W2Z9_BACCE|nr:MULTISPECIES: hypothetical protein [Bacillus cereus group]KXY50983.1 hypothetical protein AT268_31050 [Bacillus cereus]PES55530.1 hypothetical protein CN515_05665 [Bacillus cereus]PFF52023.1 hypothetical protein CN357_04865 [Bacillus cereus]PFQ39761.1 hypothetical protein COK33_09935 [Bacillus cereus]PGB15692.1 hypothetical protein COM09_08915 [Bacillus toyonensis]